MSAPIVTIIPLVPNLTLPLPATPRTRSVIPEGYGVQEQCLPFTAASGLGFLIPSPIRFGLCVPEAAPEGCRMFRSPIESPVAEGDQPDRRVFYVFDNADCLFRGNAYHFEGIPDKNSAPVLEPGISFFDRPDQQHLFKLHLPYIWRTESEVDTLFLPLLNRSGIGAEVQCGLVETDWYANAVNLILAKPAGPLHVSVGDLVAHAVCIPRHLRRVSITVAPLHSGLNRKSRKELFEWHRHHRKDRSLYKSLARSHQGRMDSEQEGTPTKS